MKILLVANTSWYLYNFRRNLLRRLLERGDEVVAVCPFDGYENRLERAGARCVAWRINRSGMNPPAELAALVDLARIYRRERPELVHHFTIKSILYGTLAARRLNVPSIVNGVTGLGHVFLSDRPATRMIRPAIRHWYSRVLTARGVCPMFQNGDDLRILAVNNPKLLQRAVHTSGSGVDLTRFAPGSAPTDATVPKENTAGLQVLFAGRLLAEKGIREYVEAARRLRAEEPSWRFLVCGRQDCGNPSSISDDELDAWRQAGDVELLGHVEPMEKLLAQVDLVVLPSYREGTPRTLLEAAAAGKPVVATSVPGCREAVVQGETGLLVPPRDPAALADGIRCLLVDDKRRQSMGAANRARAVAEFDENLVIDRTLQVYNDLHTTHRVFGKGIAGRRLERGAFTFSLDFELAWGTRGRPNAARVPPWLDGTRSAIDGMLELFEQFHVSATWVIVGALLLNGRNGKRHPWLAGDAFADIPPGNCRSHPHWYAEDVVGKLRACASPQELGCHTLTHTFVDAGPAGRESLRCELERSLELFRQWGLPRPRSFIYPKARMGHFDLLAEMGFEAVRGPENKWFERFPGELPSAALRLLDARLGCRPVVETPRRILNQLWMIPSSQFYSPLMSVGRHVRVADRVRKAVKGLRLAARTGGVFHLWTHPFNLGLHTEELLAGLAEILREADRLRADGALDILPMGEIAERLNAECGEPATETAVASA